MILAGDFLSDQKILRATATAAPRVSVILPTFCRRATLQRAIASVLTQTFTDLELIVMDDGSTDGSFELIEEFRARDPRVAHVRHEHNCGLPALRVNEGIELARGKYLAFQFDDDCWFPNALQDLVTEASRHPESVVIGKINLQTHEGKQATLPAVEVNLVKLYEQNLFANNSVLMPRDLVNKYGMYDCHIGMRRLCDWDLWLRYIQHIPFVVIDRVIGQVASGNPGAIGRTVPWDLALFRFWNAIPRNHLLTPAAWRAYPVDALGAGAVSLERDMRRRLYEEHIVPYYLTARHYFPVLEGFSATLPEPRKTVLHTRGAYDVSDDVGLNPYDAVAHQRGNYKTYFQPLDQVTPEWRRDADGLLLIRTIEDHALTLRDQALRDEIPLGYYLDDDILTFHEYGTSFDYLAPDKPAYSDLVDLIRSADAVWVTSRFIRDSVLPHNSRVIPHNGCVPSEWLPTRLKPRDPNQPIRIGYVGTNYRLDEFQNFLWQALQRLSAELGERLIFEFWGLDIRQLPPLKSPVIHRPFTFSYWAYLRALRTAAFDILLTPLLDYPRPRLGKAPSKYYQTAVAGALGIFSRVPQYANLPEGLTCLKADNTVEDWCRVLRQAITLPPEQFDLMRARLVEHVRQEFTPAAQIHLHEAAWRATEFHAKTRAQRQRDGRPRVMYVLHSANFGGGEIQLWRRLRLARDYGIEPIVVLPRVLQNTEPGQRVAESLRREQIAGEFVNYTCFTEPRSPREFSNPAEREDVRAVIQRCAPALVHTVTFIPTFGQICAELKIPHVASLYAIEDDWRWENAWLDFKHCAVVQSDSIRYATRWGDLLETVKFCSREVVPEQVFAFGAQRHLEKYPAAPPANSRTRLVATGTLQPRKRQLETIAAVAQLVREGWDCDLSLYGYSHFFPEYVEQCKRQVRALNISDRVDFHEFSDDVISILASADIVLSLSTHESFPSAIKEAMAAGVLVVATPVGGIPELIVDGITGILCADTSVDAITGGIRRALQLTPDQRERMIEQARRVARSEFHPQRAASDLMLMYNRAIDLTRAAKTTAPHAEAAPVSAQKRGRTLEPQRPPASALPLDHALTYRVVPQRTAWSGVDVLIGTHQRRACGLVRLHVFNQSGQLLRETSVDLARARDNAWLRFRFEPLAENDGEPVLIQFTLAHAGPRTLVSLYDTAPTENRFNRVVSRLVRRVGAAAPRNSLYCRMWYAG